MLSNEIVRLLAEQAFVYLMNFDNLGDKIKKLKVA